MIQTKAKAKSRAVIKGYFSMKAGQLPTKDQFGSFIDSSLNIKDDLKLEQSDIEGLVDTLAGKLDADKLPNTEKQFEALKEKIDALIEQKVTAAVENVTNAAAAAAVQVEDFVNDSIEVGKIRQYIGEADEENGYYPGFFYKKIREHAADGSKPEPEIVTELESVVIDRLSTPKQTYVEQNTEKLTQYNEGKSYELTPTDLEVTVYRITTPQTGNPGNTIIIDGSINQNGIIWEIGYATHIASVSQTDTAFVAKGVDMYKDGIEFPFANEETLPVYYNSATGDYIALMDPDGAPDAKEIIGFNEDLEPRFMCRAYSVTANEVEKEIPAPADWKMIAVSPLFVD